MTKQGKENKDSEAKEPGKKEEVVESGKKEKAIKLQRLTQVLQELAQSYERGRIEYENSKGAEKMSLMASLPLVESVACRMKSTDSISNSEGELETSDEEEEEKLEDDEESLIDDSSNEENVESHESTPEISD